MFQNCTADLFVLPSIPLNLSQFIQGDMLLIRPNKVFGYKIYTVQKNQSSLGGFFLKFEGSVPKEYIDSLFDVTKEDKKIKCNDADGFLRKALLKLCEMYKKSSFFEQNIPPSIEEAHQIILGLKG